MSPPLPRQLPFKIAPIAIGGAEGVREFGCNDKGFADCRADVIPPSIILCILPWLPCSLLF